MFDRLFADAGLSLDRLRALVEVGAAGSIARAAEGNPITQSQYSRQIKELEDFFQAKLVERHGKGIRLTPGGRELARISRFFLLGLSNFRRGCRAEEQSFRIGAGSTFIERVLLPVLAARRRQSGPRYAVEVVDDGEIERRLHDLTLDFGVVTTAAISRPLQLGELGRCRLRLWVPKAVCRDESQALQALNGKRLPLVLPVRELAVSNLAVLEGCEPRLSCSSFLEAKAVLEQETLAAFLPDFLAPESPRDRYVCPSGVVGDTLAIEYRLVWNPRLLRLNPHATRQRDFLMEFLAVQVRKQSAEGRAMNQRHSSNEQPGEAGHSLRARNRGSRRC